MGAAIDQDSLVVDDGGRGPRDHQVPWRRPWDVGEVAPGNPVGGDPNRTGGAP